MRSFLVKSLAMLADIIGSIVGLLLLYQGFILLTGLYCHYCLGTFPWWVSLSVVITGIVFIIPNALFKSLCTRLTARQQKMASTMRVVITSTLALVLIIHEAPVYLPLWLVLIIMARPLSALAFTLNPAQLQNRVDEQQETESL